LKLLPLNPLAELNPLLANAELRPNIELLPASELDIPERLPSVEPESPALREPRAVLPSDDPSEPAREPADERDTPVPSGPRPRPTERAAEPEDAPLKADRPAVEPTDREPEPVPKFPPRAIDVDPVDADPKECQPFPAALVEPRANDPEPAAKLLLEPKPRLEATAEPREKFWLAAVRPPALPNECQFPSAFAALRAPPNAEVPERPAMLLLMLPPKPRAEAAPFWPNPRFAGAEKFRAPPEKPPGLL
jgi:hypothetical protein